MAATLRSSFSLLYHYVVSLRIQSSVSQHAVDEVYGAVARENLFTDDGASVYEDFASSSRLHVHATLIVVAGDGGERFRGAPGGRAQRFRGIRARRGEPACLERRRRRKTSPRRVDLPRIARTHRSSARRRCTYGIRSRAPTSTSSPPTRWRTSTRSARTRDIAPACATWVMGAAAAVRHNRCSGRRRRRPL